MFERTVTHKLSLAAAAELAASRERVEQLTRALQLVGLGLVLLAVAVALVRRKGAPVP